MVFAGDVAAADDIARPRFLGSLSGSLANSTVLTPLTISSTTLDTALMVSGNTVVIPTGGDGEYDIGAYFRYSANSTGVRQGRIVINGSVYVDYTTAAVNGFNTQLELITKAILFAGDVVTFGGYQSSGGTLALTGTCPCWVEKVIA